MMYLGEEELTQVMGIGSVGEVRQGPEGALYQWVQGVDGLGSPIGFWRRLRRLARGVRGIARRAMPIIQQVAPFIPGGAAVAAGLTTAAPLLRRAGIPGSGGLGALYQAPDGTLYQVQGVAGSGLGEPELMQGMGIGSTGEVRQGPGGNLYQWAQGVDGLGNPIGFWRRLRRVGRGLRRLAQRAMPIIQQVAPFVPAGAAVAAGLRTAAPLLRQAGVAGHDGLGVLYQAPDGMLYQVQGFAEDEELQGLAEDDELRGFAEDEELQGLAEDEELTGLAEDEELQGLDGYVRQDGISGVEAFVPQEPPRTRWHVPPAQSPEMWKPLW